MKTTRTLADIENDITQIKEKLRTVKGGETEVYARIVGYYRSVRNWNKGKRDEFNHRKEFVMADAPLARREPEQAAAAPEAITADRIEGYEFYSRKTCPNCPPVRDYLAECVLKGTVIDVDSGEGLAKAAENGVCSAPTVILLNAFGRETARAHTRAELAALVKREAIAV